MLIDGAALTESPAQDIANMIQSLYSSGSRDYFKLKYQHRLDGETTCWIRPLRDQAPYDLENRAQIIRCETDDGKLLSVVIPLRRREFQPALVILPASTDQ